jgi:hypothetical protein
VVSIEKSLVTSGADNSFVVDEDPEREPLKNSDGSELDWFAEIEPLRGATTFAATFSSRFEFNKVYQFDARVALGRMLPDLAKEKVKYAPRVCSARLLVAALWITIAGPKIYQVCLRGDEFASGERNAEAAFTSATWIQWKQQIQKLMGTDEVDARSIELASQAVAIMESLTPE